MAKFSTPVTRPFGMISVDLNQMPRTAAEAKAYAATQNAAARDRRRQDDQRQAARRQSDDDVARETRRLASACPRGHAGAGLSASEIYATRYGQGASR